ncbi:MAG: 3-keto-disaccharide hydrolase [Gemmataceae bacterium]
MNCFVSNCVVQILLALNGAEGSWIELIPQGNLDAFVKPSPKLVWTDKVELDAKNPKKLTSSSEKGIILFNNNDRIPDLITKQSFGDHEIHMEFMVAKGSNSGIKMHRLYEIQIHDSHGKTELTGEHCGGVYPRWDIKEKKLAYIDKGVPPSKNVCKPAGEWQTLDITFIAAKFDESGNKIKNAHLPKVLLNGELIHDQVELKHGTGNNYKLKEHSKAPILIQVDHGPVAFRNIKVRELNQ